MGWQWPGIIICSAPRSTQITMPVPHQSVFYRQDALPPPNQECQKIKDKMVQILTSYKLLYKPMAKSMEKGKFRPPTAPKPLNRFR